MKNKTVYFIGIKGTGMASLAKIIKSLGNTVMGSDISQHFFTEDSLVALDIPIYEFSKDNIPENSIVIIGNAFKDDNVEVIQAKSMESVKTYSYHEYLGELMKSYRSIGVSGSHGKTTTTTLLTDMLAHTKKTGYLIGDGNGDLNVEDEYFVVEACEYKRHFLEYYPEIGIMTNFELDHVDYFKSEKDYLASFEEFSKNIKELLVVWGDDPHLKDMTLHCQTLKYGFSEKNDLYVKNMEKHRDKTVFDVYYDHEFVYRFNLPIVGDHMVLNALSTIAVGLYEEMDPKDIELGLQNFTGALRRFVIEEGKENVYIDDYAHHPTEIDVTLKAAKTRYPDHKIIAIFKGYRVGRLQYFANEFASSLSQADEVCLCPLTSIDDYEEGIDMDVEDLQKLIPGSYLVDVDEEGLDLLESFGPAVYVFMSAKDIYHLKDALKTRYND